MKKILFLLAITLAHFFSASAQDQNLVIDASSFQNLAIGSDMKVVLIATPVEAKEVKLNSAALQKLSFGVKKNTLELLPQGNLHSTDVVYVKVANLKSVKLGANSTITTEGVLYANNIDVFVEEGSTAKLTTNAKVNGFHVNGEEVKITRSPILVPAKNVF
jgi:hypothetical protein